VRKWNDTYKIPGSDSKAEMEQVRKKPGIHSENKPLVHI